MSVILSLPGLVYSLNVDYMKCKVGMCTVNVFHVYGRSGLFHLLAAEAARPCPRQNPQNVQFWLKIFTLRQPSLPLCLSLSLPFGRAGAAAFGFAPRRLRQDVFSQRHRFGNLRFAPFPPRFYLPCAVGSLLAYVTCTDLPLSFPSLERGKCGGSGVSPERWWSDVISPKNPPKKR